MQCAMSRTNQHCIDSPPELMSNSRQVIDLPFFYGHGCILENKIKFTTMLKQLRHLFLQQQALYEQYRHKLIRKTVNRFIFIGMVASPVSAAHVWLFWHYSPVTQAEFQWRTGLISYHATLMVTTALLGLMAWTCQKKPDSSQLLRVTYWFGFITVLLAGVVVVSIDQLVTPAVTPYLIACTVIGALFLMPPWHAATISAVLYGSFHYAIGLTQTDPEILLSNQVNGLTATGLAFGLLLIQWRSHIIQLNQEDRIQEQQSLLEDSNRRLQRLATEDELTGLANRRLFNLLVKEELVLQQRHGRPPSLILLDIDHFKKVNDRYGHLTGDEVLKSLARVLKGAVRNSDLVCRWGGEEFAILLRHSSASKAAEVAENLRQKVAAATFTVDGIPIKLTISLGISEFDYNRENALEEAYQRADHALYRAKNSGRNQVQTSYSSPAADSGVPAA